VKPLNLGDDSVSLNFSNKSFKYFDAAGEHRIDRSWFEDHRSLYDEGVRQPFCHLLERIKEQQGRALPRIKIETAKVTRPLRPSNRADDQGLAINFSFATLCEKNKSRFEWNPAIHIQFGAKKEDNL
jgi:uncharacterized protein (DUF2461 family)